MNARRDMGQLLDGHLHEVTEQAAADPLLAVPFIEDDLWHRIRRTAELDNVVDGVPIISLCGLRFRSAQHMIRKGESAREHAPCQRCNAIHTYILRR